MKRINRNLLPLWLSLATFTLSVMPAPLARAGSWTTNSPMNTARYHHTAILLQSGKVLVTGGWSSSAELYDPATGKWTLTGEMLALRIFNTATLLPNGKVLVVGGSDLVSEFVSSAELYDPATGQWTATGSLINARDYHTATLLKNGKVLVVGGRFSDSWNGYNASAELYDPATGIWQVTGSLNTARASHTATLLTNGLVLVAAGEGYNGYQIASAELYDPDTGLWTNTAPLSAGRRYHTATLLRDGRVLVAGGGKWDPPWNLASAEIFDPVAGTWTTSAMNAAHACHTATLLPNGQVLVAGGEAANWGVGINGVELFNPVTGLWTTNSPLKVARENHTATLLANGSVLVAGGDYDLAHTTNSVEVFDYASGTNTVTAAMNTARSLATATLLPNGKVLVAGGQSAMNLASAEWFNPASGTWANTGTMNAARKLHTATLLPNGEVLVAGGEGSSGNPINNAELFDPASQIWSSTNAMNNNREAHTATLLPNGKVLAVGGLSINGSGMVTNTAELFDPATGTWTLTGHLSSARDQHSATLLPNGKVLVVGGRPDFASVLASAELYDLTTGTWTNTGSLNSARYNHSATLLPNGQVLVAGGIGNGSLTLTSAELYDPVKGTWTLTGAMSGARLLHSATLLPNGKVLVEGGDLYTNSTFFPLSRAELYDPAYGTWTTNVLLTYKRASHTATLLLDGRLLIVGGTTNYNFGLPVNTAKAEIYEIGLGYTNTAQPQISGLTSPLNLGSSLVVTGAQFRGIGEGSSGNSQDSSADYPLVQLRSLESGQTVFLSSTNWGKNSFTSLPVWNFPPGHALATVFVNGIQSTSSIVNVSVPILTAPTMTSLARQTNGTFSFSFTNSVGAVFGVLASTNLSLPQTNWTALGGVTEVAPGQFQFSDAQATNSGRRYYRLFAP